MFTFRHDRTDSPECEDDMHVLLKDGTDTGFAIQDARSYGGKYAINQYLYEDGKLTGCRYLAEARSLKAAKALCQAYAEK